MNAKNVITWKDADQNLCRIAAIILRDAMRELRVEVPGPWRPNMTRLKGKIPKDYAAPPGEWWGWHSENGHMGVPDGQGGHGEHDEFYGYLDIFLDELKWEWQGDLSIQCWWGFQNIVRWRLREARESLWENCYGSNKRKTKHRRIHSRNRNKRKQDIRRDR